MDARQVVADVHPRYFGAELNDQSLTPGDNPRIAPTRFEDWLSRSIAAKTKREPLWGRSRRAHRSEDEPTRLCGSLLGELPCLGDCGHELRRSEGFAEKCRAALQDRLQVQSSLGITTCIDRRGRPTVDSAGDQRRVQPPPATLPFGTRSRIAMTCTLNAPRNGRSAPATS
jgi:hypothetical protein